MQLNTSPFCEAFTNVILQEGDCLEVHGKELGKFLAVLEFSRLLPELVMLQTR